MWLWTVLISLRATPGSTMSWKWIGRKYSPTMCSFDSGSRWWMSATRPAIVFSIGIMARSALPVSTASKASSKVGQGSGSMSGNMLRQAVSELAPGSPWKEMRLVFSCGMSPALSFREHMSGALEVVRRVDAERHGSTISTSMRMPASSARSCSSLSRRSSGEGGSETKRSSAARR